MEWKLFPFFLWHTHTHTHTHISCACCAHRYCICRTLLKRFLAFSFQLSKTLAKIESGCWENNIKEITKKEMREKKKERRRKKNSVNTLNIFRWIWIHGEICMKVLSDIANWWRIFGWNKNWWWSICGLLDCWLD